MANSEVVSTSAQRWKAAYRSAIFEKNTRAIATKVCDAENMIVCRARELFKATGTDAEVERDSLEDALYALRALRNATEHTFHVA